MADSVMISAADFLPTGYIDEMPTVYVIASKLSGTALAAGGPACCSHFDQADEVTDGD